MTSAVLILIGLSVLLALVRFIKGPSSIDRIVALDTINMEIIGLIAVLALIFKNNLFLDVALVYAILAFIETVVFAKYIEG